jgi:CheY-like chemotaxis protein
MDGRMPEMDGATATRIIRAGGTPESRVLDPNVMIVALTANASGEDRARYLACGMDAFLTKPIDEDALHQQVSRAIERQLARGIALPPMPAATPGDAAQPPQVPPLAALDAMFGVAPAPHDASGDAEASNPGRRADDLAGRLRAAFAADLPRRRAELAQAIEANDLEAAGRVLHGLRGSAAYLGETALGQLCADLEAAADAGDRVRLLAGMARLGVQLAVFQPS